MGPDEAVEIMRRVLSEAMMLSAPLLVTAALVSLAVSLLQTLTSVQEQTLTAVPGLVVVVVVTLAVLPRMVPRLVGFPGHLFTGFPKCLAYGGSELGLTGL